jgi:hypothetical protein
MSLTDGKLQSASLEGFRALKMIPLVIRWTAGAPAVVQNPSNEELTLTDVGAGDLTITLASAGLAPLVVPGISIVVADANTLSLEVNLDGAPTSSVVRLVINSGADGATETDPVDIHLVVYKLVAG